MPTAYSCLPLASLCSLTLGCATPAAGTRFDVGVREKDGACVTTFEGRDVASAEMLEIARVRARKTHEAKVATEAAHMPWRCVAGLIYTLQMAGFSKVDVASLSSSRRAPAIPSVNRPDHP